MHQLPKLSQLIIPSALSLIKGVKVKPEGISLQRVFDGVMIDAADVKQYCAFWNGTTHNRYVTCICWLSGHR